MKNIELVFGAGGGLRTVFIKDNIVTLISAETNYVPVQMDINKMRQNEKLKNDPRMQNLMMEVNELKTEEDMAKDIIKDFQEQGWRLIKRNG